MIAEIQYAWTLGYGDSTNNFVWQESQLEPGYPASPDGQLSLVNDVLSILAAVPGATSATGCSTGSPSGSRASAGSPARARRTTTSRCSTSTGRRCRRSGSSRTPAYIHLGDIRSTAGAVRRGRALDLRAVLERAERVRASSRWSRRRWPMRARHGRRATPDLVLLDLDAARRRRARSVRASCGPRSDVPIIILTARGTELERVRRARAGRRRLRGQAVQRRRGDRAHAGGAAAGRGRSPRRLRPVVEIGPLRVELAARGACGSRRRRSSRCRARSSTCWPSWSPTPARSSRART